MWTESLLFRQIITLFLTAVHFSNTICHQWSALWSPFLCSSGLLLFIPLFFSTSLWFAFTSASLSCSLAPLCSVLFPSASLLCASSLSPLFCSTSLSFYSVIEKEYVLRFKSFTFQIESEITQSHSFLGARSQHLCGGRWSWRHCLALGGEIFFAPVGSQLPSRQTPCALPVLLQDAWAGWRPGGACRQVSLGQ